MNRSRSHQFASCGPFPGAKSEREDMASILEGLWHNTAENPPWCSQTTVRGSVRQKVVCCICIHKKWHRVTTSLLHSDTPNLRRLLERGMRVSLICCIAISLVWNPKQHSANVRSHLWKALSSCSQNLPNERVLQSPTKHYRASDPDGQCLACGYSEEHSQVLPSRIEQHPQ